MLLATHHGRLEALKIIGGAEFTPLQGLKLGKIYAASAPQRSTGKKSQACGSRVTRCGGGFWKSSGVPFHRVMTTSRKSGEENISLDMCIGLVSTVGTATSQT